MQILSIRPANIVQPIGSINPFHHKPIILNDRFSRWRSVAKMINLSSEGCLRLERMIFYFSVGKENATATAVHFGIARQNLHKWLKRFKGSLYNVRSLESLSCRPHHLRQKEITLIQKDRVIKIRKAHLHWGREKLKALYQKQYQEDISAWKIECVIREYPNQGLYPNPVKRDKVAIKRKHSLSHPKKRIQNLNKQSVLWFLMQLDGITIYWNGLKRYILTAVDHAGKFGFARMYKSKSASNASDFLYRLNFAINQPILNLQTDNGSEFMGTFERALHKLQIEHYYSRIRTPKDNPEVERFNQTLEDEWLNDGHFTPECDRFNQKLTDWLIEYNFVRPHQTLAYQTPMEYIQNNSKVSSMYSARTFC